MSVTGRLGKIRTLVLDTYTNLRYKRAFDTPRNYVGTWVPALDLDRLTAYRVLAAYQENVAREHIPATNETERRNHREYGDAELIVQRVVAGVLGDDMQLVVDGANDDPPDTPVLPPRPDEPAAGDEIAAAAHAAALRVWEQRSAAAVADWERTWDELPALRERQEWLRKWADDELFDQAVWEAEGDVVGLGDGVYVFETSYDEQRIKVDVYDPGFYFPVLDEAARARGFPLTIHLAFELDLDEDGQTDHVRRITHQLGVITPMTVMTATGPVYAVREEIDDPDIGRTTRIRPAELGETPSLMDGDRYRDDGRIVRTYPWAVDGEESILTCYKTDATWLLSDVAGRTVHDFPDDKAMYAVNETFDPIRRLDLRQDFIPVIHIPNTPSRRDHFGRSVLARVLQLLDDLAGTDSDIQAAAALAGTPMLGLSGKNSAGSLVVRPGATFNLGEGGRLDAVDLSGPLKALLELLDLLLDRLGVNVQVPGEVTGRVEDTGAESGYARALKTGPYAALIKLLRLVRDPKYRLALKFVQRMAQAAGFLPPGPTMPARIAFGSFLPADRKAAIEEVVLLLQAKGVSRRTALQLLVDIGIDIGDIAEELARLDAEDLDSAAKLFEATGDQDLVNTRLGIAPTGRQEPPVPVLPEV